MTRLAGIDIAAAPVVVVPLFLLGLLVLSVVAARLARSAATRWTLRLGVSLAYQGALIAGFCFVINLWLLQRYRPSVLAAFFLTQPIFGVFVATLLTGDALTTQLLIACLAVAAGIGLSTR